VSTATVVVLAVAVVLVGLAVWLVVRRRGSAPPRSGSLPDPGRTSPTPPPTQAPAPAPPPSAAVRGDGLGAKVRALFGRGADEQTWRDLEDLLLRADVGPRGAADLVGRVRERFQPGADPAELLRDEMVGILGPDQDLDLPADRLGVVLVVGVNGSGKTTTIGKLASRLAAAGRTVSLAGSDTFRAAAGEQLGVWGDRAGAHVVSQERGADPASVAFDAVRSATARGSNVLLVDTAGRLHTKTPLMDELAKVKRVIDKAGASVDETLLVLDATTGQNGIAQARAFTEAVEVTGVALTKMDGSAKGGIVLAVREELGLPVRLVGTGEGAGDLEPFRARAFAERLLGG
jgi:fused signal recognition particle receptor